jgi:YVTN family beta-propeller protein
VLCVEPPIIAASGTPQDYSTADAGAEFGPDSDYWAPAEDVVATITLGGRVATVVANPESAHVYVAEPDSVAVIGGGNHVVARIPLSGEPRELVIDADGTRLFAVGYDGSVSVIGTEDHTVTTFSGSWNSEVVVSADGAYLAAAETRRSTDGAESCIAKIDVVGNVVATVPVANDVVALAISPDGTRLYVASSDHQPYHQYPDGWLTVIDAVSNSVITTIAVGASPDGVTVSPDGARLFVTHHDTRSISAVDLTIDAVTSIALGDAPVNVKFTPDGAHAYVTSLHSATVIDTGTNEAMDIAIGGLPRGLQISPDGKRAYITNFGDRTVSVVDTITNSITAAVAVGGHPEAITVSSDGERVYVGDYWSGTVTVISAPSVQDQHMRVGSSAVLANTLVR